jgi:hypothetical protein
VSTLPSTARIMQYSEVNCLLNTVLICDLNRTISVINCENAFDLLLKRSIRYGGLWIS